MKTDVNLLVKGLKYIGLTVFFMFVAPFTVYQAFKNDTHPMYIPVLIVGLLLAITAIAFGFYSIKLIMDAIFNKKK